MYKTISEDCIINLSVAGSRAKLVVKKETIVLLTVVSGDVNNVFIVTVGDNVKGDFGSFTGDLFTGDLLGQQHLIYKFRI